MMKKWLTFREATALVKDRCKASIGRSEAIFNTARASGEIRSRKEISLWADDGMGGGRYLSFSTADLVDWLGRHHPENPATADPMQAISRDKRPSSARRGRPPRDWETIRKEAFELMEYHGEFLPDDPWNAQARLEEILHDKFDVGISTLREHLPGILSAWREAKAGK
jgi:hypothetical protein